MTLAELGPAAALVLMGAITGAHFAWSKAWHRGWERGFEDYKKLHVETCERAVEPSPEEKVK